MNHDITFCSNSSKCPQRATCRRASPPTDVQWLSFSVFYKAGEECKSYWPTGEKK